MKRKIIDLSSYPNSIVERNTIDFISLGCSKNLVDSERLMALCEARGYRCTHDSDNPQGSIVVINTCGFIADAKEESINTILEFVAAKQKGTVERVYVMGCLSERYLAELEEEIPEVDGWFGKFNYEKLLDEITMSENHATDRKNVHPPRKLTTPRHYAYLKISEGCDRRCAYCAIPLITGHYRSRPMEDILDEVRWLVSRGVKELQVIAQDLTYYGLDLYGEQRIAELVEKMADIQGVRWIRLHYAYPTNFPWDLLRVMREKPNVCKYLDIALQHINNNVLERMHRHITKEETIEMIDRFRREVPGIYLRTTLMVGFPGETGSYYKELIDFVKTARFERMGAFTYSEEEGTYAANHYQDDVPEDVKQQRLGRLMRIQQTIASEVAEEEMKGTRVVVIDREEGDYYVGRTEHSSPEVDPEVLISIYEGPLEIGEFYDVEMYDYESFDFFAHVVGLHHWD